MNPIAPRQIFDSQVSPCHALSGPFCPGAVRAEHSGGQATKVRSGARASDSSLAWDVVTKVVAGIFILLGKNPIWYLWIGDKIIRKKSLAQRYLA